MHIIPREVAESLGLNDGLIDDWFDVDDLLEIPRDPEVEDLAAS